MVAAVLGQTASFNVTAGDIIFVDAGGVGKVTLYSPGKQPSQFDISGSIRDIVVPYDGTASVYLESGAFNYFVNNPGKGASLMTRDQQKSSTGIASTNKGGRTLGASSAVNSPNYIVIGDSRGRISITPTGSITTIASYDTPSYAKLASNGKLKKQAIAGNSGFDIKETLDIIDSRPPANALSSTGASAVTAWGLNGVDLSQVGIAFIRLGINHFSDFNFTNPSFNQREAVNAPLRAAIKEYANTLVQKLGAVPIVIWQTEGAVGPASVNFNGGDTIERGYIWHEKWFTSMLNELCSVNSNLQVFDTSSIFSDAANIQYKAKQYLTLSTDGSQNAQDMHETHYAYKLCGQRLWQMLDPYVNKSAPLGIPVAASDKISISRDSKNVYPDSLLVGSTVPARILRGGGTGTVVPVVDADITGQIYPEMAVQVNQTVPIVLGNVTITTKIIPCPSGFGNAVQADILFNINFDGSLGFRLYNQGVAINAAITSAFLTFNENKTTQTCCYMKAGLATGTDGQVTDFVAFRSFAAQQRIRTTINNQFSTSNAYGASNSGTDYSTMATGLQVAGQFEGVLTTPAIKIEGVTPASPNQMQTQTMAAPNTNEYLYFNVVAKVNSGQTARIIIGNVGLYVDSLRADGLIPDIV